MEYKVSPGIQLLNLSRCIVCIGKIGVRVHMEPTPDGLAIRAVNPARSAFVCLKLTKQFFHSTPTDYESAACCMVSSKALCIPFTGRKINSAAGMMATLSFNTIDDCSMVKIVLSPGLDAINTSQSAAPPDNFSAGDSSKANAHSCIYTLYTQDISGQNDAMQAVYSKSHPTANSQTTFFAQISLSVIIMAVLTCSNSSSGLSSGLAGGGRGKVVDDEMELKLNHEKQFVDFSTGTSTQQLSVNLNGKSKCRLCRNNFVALDFKLPNYSSDSHSSSEQDRGGFYSYVFNIRELRWWLNCVHQMYGDQMIVSMYGTEAGQPFIFSIDTDDKMVFDLVLASVDYENDDIVHEDSNGVNQSSRSLVAGETSPALLYHTHQSPRNILLIEDSLETSCSDVLPLSAQQIEDHKLSLDCGSCTDQIITSAVSVEDAGWESALAGTHEDQGVIDRFANDNHRSPKRACNLPYLSSIDLLVPRSTADEMKPNSPDERDQCVEDEFVDVKEVQCSNNDCTDNDEVGGYSTSFLLRLFGISNDAADEEDLWDGPMRHSNDDDLGHVLASDSDCGSE